jgi:hypothetical protein
MRWRLGLLAFLFLGVLSSRGQAPDAFEENLAADPKFSHQYRFLQSSGYYFIDTSFSSLKWYRNLNGIYQDDFGSLPLHNMGDARNLLVLPEVSGLENYFGFGPFREYFTHLDRVPFYQCRSPYTKAQYFSALNRGQAFSILHTQNVNERWNFLIRYRRLNSLGVYQNAQNIQSRLLLNTHYQSPQGRYELYAYFTNEQLEVQENGGLENDSAFEENLDVPRETLLMNLRGGTADNRVIANREVFAQQQFNLVRRKQAVADSSDTLKAFKSSNYLALVHQFKYQRRTLTYRSATTDFYDNYFFARAPITDSLAYNAVDNKLLLKTELGDSTGFNLAAGARALQYRYANNYFNNTTNNLALTGTLNGRIKNWVDVQGELDYFFAGALINNLRLRSEAKISLYKELYAQASYTYTVRSPDLYSQQYISNNFIWLNRFADVTTGILQGRLGWKNGYIKAKQFNANNWVYFAADQQPAQANQAIKYTQLEARQNFDFWDFVHLDNRVVFQQNTSGENILPLPQWVTRNALYFDFHLFKRALKCIVGTELNYFSSFNSPSYSPGTGRFFVANQKEIGNYPYLDVFAQFKVRTAKVFLKYQHVNEGLLDYRYYAAPGYPLPDRVLRIGISWRFFN